jgi:hypothetical protein
MDDIVLTILSALLGGLLATALTLIAMRWSTLRSIESAKEMLRTQLLYDEKKKALKELNRLVEQRYETYPAFKEAILAFLKTLEADFLPVELRPAIEFKIDELDKFLENKGLVAPEPSNEEIESWMKGYDEYREGLPFPDREELEFEDRLREIRSSIRQLITEHIKP